MKKIYSILSILVSLIIGIIIGVFLKINNNCDINNDNLNISNDRDLGINNDRDSDFVMKEQCLKYKDDVLKAFEENIKGSVVKIKDYGVFYSNKNNTCVGYGVASNIDYEGNGVISRWVFDILTNTEYLDCNALIENYDEHDSLDPYFNAPEGIYTKESLEELEQMKCINRYNNYLKEKERDTIYYGLRGD